MQPTSGLYGTFVTLLLPICNPFGVGKNGLIFEDIYKIAGDEPKVRYIIPVSPEA